MMPIDRFAGVRDVHTTTVSNITACNRKWIYKTVLHKGHMLTNKQEDLRVFLEEFKLTGRWLIVHRPREQ